MAQEMETKNDVFLCGCHHNVFHWLRVYVDSLIHIDYDECRI